MLRKAGQGLVQGLSRRQGQSEQLLESVAGVVQQKLEG
jgi:hypothetical protein